MSNAVALTNSIEAALIQGDLSKLSSDQRLSYYKQVCESVGMNPLTKPFEYIMLNGKLTLYALRAATDQLRKIHKVSINITDRNQIGDVYVVTAKAKDAEGREDESTGAVTISGLKGEALANAFLKAETKAKRRVTLSICGLGLLDESEVDSIPAEAKTPAPAPVAQVQAPTAEPACFQEAPVAPERILQPGNYVISFGRKYKGRKLGDIPRNEMEEYIKWLENSASAEGKPVSQQAQYLRKLFDALRDQEQFDQRSTGG